MNNSITDEVDQSQEPPVKKTKFQIPKENAKSKVSDTAAVLKMMSDVYKERKEARAADEYDIFGELIARKLRNLKTAYSRSTVQVWI